MLYPFLYIRINFVGFFLTIAQKKALNLGTREAIVDCSIVTRNSARLRGAMAGVSGDICNRARIDWDVSIRR